MVSLQKCVLCLMVAILPLSSFASGGRAASGKLLLAREEFRLVQREDFSHRPLRARVTESEQVKYELSSNSDWDLSDLTLSSRNCAAILALSAIAALFLVFRDRQR